MACEWHGDHDLWPVAGGFCVCSSAQEQPANNWQSVGQRVGFTTSVVHACQRPRTVSQLETMANVSDCHKSQLRLANLAQIDHPHESKMTKWRDFVKMMDFNEEKNGESE